MYVCIFLTYANSLYVHIVHVYVRTYVHYMYVYTVCMYCVHSYAFGCFVVGPPNNANGK